MAIEIALITRSGKHSKKNHVGTTKWMASWFLPQPVRSSQAAELQFPHLENGNNTHFTGGLILLSGTEHTKHVTHGKPCRSFLLSPLCTYGKGAQHWSPGRQRERERGERRQRRRERQTGGGGRREDRHTAVSLSAGPDSATRQAPLSVARIQEWVAFPFSRESSQASDRTWVSCTAGGFIII